MNIENTSQLVLSRYGAHQEIRQRYRLGLNTTPTQLKELSQTIGVHGQEQISCKKNSTFILNKANDTHRAVKDVSTARFQMGPSIPQVTKPWMNSAFHHHCLYLCRYVYLDTSENLVLQKAANGICQRTDLVSQ